MAKTASKPIEDLSYEEAFEELEKIVATLETGESSLEESMALFERGRELSSHCAGLLEKAELKVKELSSTGIEDFQENE